MYLDRQFEKLDRVGVAARAAAKSARPGKRTPDYARFAVEGTRPHTGAGVTFHFKHSSVAKGRDVSAGQGRDFTTAPAHQRYLERRGAAELVGEGGEASPISFGTIGATRAERVRFWREVERAEAGNGRVQCRVILELPHELSPEGRERAARRFVGRTLGARGLPHWAVAHAPGEGNDSRNFHLHVAYHDRPAARLDDGRWDFEAVELRVYASGNRRLVRPRKQRKDRGAQGRAWVKGMRAAAAAAMNGELEREGLVKRYDPRSYKDAGLAKEPTLHLGSASARFEARGVDTQRGCANACKEVAWRLRSAGQGFERSALAAAALRREADERRAEGDDPRAAAALAELDRHDALGRRGEEAAPIAGAQRALRPFVDGSLAAAAALKAEAASIEREQAELRAGVEATLAASREVDEPFDDGEPELLPASGRSLMQLKELADEPEAPVGRHSDDDELDLVPLLGRPLLTLEDLTDEPQAPVGGSLDNGGSEEPRPPRLIKAHCRANPFRPETRPVGGWGEGLTTEHPKERQGPPEANPPRPGMPAAKPSRERALTLDPHASAAAVERLDRSLDRLSNAELRLVAVVTEDAADLVEDERLAGAHRAAAARIDAAADRRGLDLVSGLRSARRALAPELFDLHDDEARVAPPEPWRGDRARER